MIQQASYVIHEFVLAPFLVQWVYKLLKLADLLYYGISSWIEHTSFKTFHVKKCYAKRGSHLLGQVLTPSTKDVIEENYCI